MMRSAYQAPRRSSTSGAPSGLRLPLLTGTLSFAEGQDVNSPWRERRSGVRSAWPCTPGERDRLTVDVVHLPGGGRASPWGRTPVRSVEGDAGAGDVLHHELIGRPGLRPRTLLPPNSLGFK
jgi:hypothetical protein